MLSVGFRVYTAGMQIISEGHDLPLSIATDAPDQAIGATSNDGGTLIPIAADGTLNAPVATGFLQFPGGLTTGQDGNWHLGSRVSGDFRILKVRRDGTFETFVTMPSHTFFVDTGPGGEFYPSLCFVDQLYRVSVDGSVIEPFGPTIPCPLFYRFPVDDGPPGTGDIGIRLAMDDIVNLGGLAKSIPGEEFRIPLNMEISADAMPVANYTLELSWDVEKLDLLDLAQGDFTTGPGSFVANTTGAENGSLVLPGTEPESRGIGGGNFTLFTLDLVVDESLGAGEVLAVSIQATEVGGESNEDLLSLVGVRFGQICLSPNPIGDLTLDGKASAADATQILRHIVGLPAAPGIDLDRGDVTGDGTVGVGDVVDVLRNLVGLSVPPSSRVDKPPLESCSDGRLTT